MGCPEHLSRAVEPHQPGLAEQLRNITIRIGNQPMNATMTPDKTSNAICREAAAGNRLSPVTITCVTAGPMTGRYLSVQLVGQRTILTLCAVNVSAVCGHACGNYMRPLLALEGAQVPRVITERQHE